MWTASVINTAADPTYPNVAVAVVDFTDGTRTARVSLRGVSDLDSLKRQIAQQIGAYEAVDAFVAVAPTGPIDPTLPTLTPEQIAGIRAVADFAQSDAVIADALNTASRANPVAQGMVAPVLTVANVLGLLSAASVGRLSANPNAATIRNDLRAQDREAVVLWAGLMQAGGTITAAEHDAVVAACTTPVPDPTWTALVSPASIILGRAATAADIAVARPA